jgi:hypothetical protein
MPDRNAEAKIDSTRDLSLAREIHSLLGAAAYSAAIVAR